MVEQKQDLEITKLWKLESVAKIPEGKEQLAEIERRLSWMYEDCVTRKVSMSQAHIRLVLGIDDNTLNRWMKGKVQEKNGASRKEVALEASRLSEEVKSYRIERRESLKKWLAAAEYATAEAINANPKAGGPMFVAKASYGWRDSDNGQNVNVSVSLEDFLNKSKTPAK